MTDLERKAGREVRSRPVVDEFKIWLDSISGQVLPKSLLGIAVGYARNQWPKLVVFLTDGRLELDNNRSERSIKPFLIGRKNWLFAEVRPAPEKMRLEKQRDLSLGGVFR